MNQSTALAMREDRAPALAPLSVFSSMEAFENAKAMCGALVMSNLVPEAYRGNANMGNAMIALDMANRMGIAPIMVMQNLDVIEGRPSWKSQFIIAAINSCGLFSPLRFDVVDHGEVEASYETWGQNKGERVRKSVKVRNLECRATALEKRTGELLDGPPVSVSMAVAEGWYARKGSKWQTMPELMLRYRAAAFFGRLYAPHILNGMPTVDETVEIEADYHELPRVDPGAPAEPAGKPGRSRGVNAALRRAAEAVAGGAEADPDEGANDTPAPDGKGTDEGSAETREDRRQGKPEARGAKDERSTAARRDREREAEAEELRRQRERDEAADRGPGNGDPGHQGDDLPFGEPGDEDDDDNYQPA